jgi:hypothetical protein
MSLYIKRIRGKKHKVVITMVVDIDDTECGNVIGNAVDPDQRVAEVLEAGVVDAELAKFGIRVLMFDTLEVPKTKR